MSERAGSGAAVAAVAIGAAVLGLTPIWVRMSELGPQATNFWRYVFALPILVVLAAITGPNPNAKQTGWLLAAGVLFGIECGLWAAALSYTTVVNATLLANMTPIFAALLAWLLFKEHPRAAVLGGAVVSLAGAILLAFARSQNATGPANSAHEGWIGDALGLSAAVGYAGYLMIVRSLRDKVGIGAVMFWSTLSACAFALIVSQVLGEDLLPRTQQGWLILIGLGVVTHAGAQGAIAWGVGRLPIAASTVLLWLQPLSAALLSWWLFGEQLGPLAFVGAALILGGLFVVQRARAPA